MTNMSLVAVHAAWILAVTNSEFAKYVENELIRNPRGSDIEMVTPEIRKEVILYLRRYADGADPDSGTKAGLGPDPGAQLLLLRLGDEQQIEEYSKSLEAAISKFRGISRARIDYSGEAAQPLLIPRLAKYFFADDGDNFWDDRIVDDVVNILYPVSVGSAVTTLAILRNSPVFDTAVQKWADNAYQRVIHAEYKKLGFTLPDHLIPFPTATDIDLADLRKSMREWWRENARYFETKDYASVKPGVPIASPSVEPKPPVSAEVTQQPKGSAEPPLATAPAAQPAPAPSTSSPLIYPLAIGFTALLLGTLALFLRRKT